LQSLYLIIHRSSDPHRVVGVWVSIYKWNGLVL
jgi:hypothetical protein